MHAPYERDNYPERCILAWRLSLCPGTVSTPAVSIESAWLVKGRCGSFASKIMRFDLGTPPVVVGSMADLFVCLPAPFCTALYVAFVQHGHFVSRDCGDRLVVPEIVLNCELMPVACMCSVHYVPYYSTCYLRKVATCNTLIGLCNSKKIFFFSSTKPVNPRQSGLALPLEERMPKSGCQRRTGSKTMKLRTGYLLLYNAVQFLIWMTTLLRAIFVLMLTLSNQPFSAIPFLSPTLPERIYHASHTFVHAGQTLAWLEVVHALSGIAGGGPAAPFIQCLGRYVVLVFLIERIPLTHASLTTPILFTAWAIADAIRYAHYCTTLLELNFYPLLWLRYSVFILLQPVGIFAEWYTYFSTLHFIDEARLYEIVMPNSWNFSFNFGTFNRLVLVAYFYFGPFMFRHMLHQRRIKLTRPHRA